VISNPGNRRESLPPGPHENTTDNPLNDAPAIGETIAPVLDNKLETCRAISDNLPAQAKGTLNFIWMTNLVAEIQTFRW
jgi:hypothetical protein